MANEYKILTIPFAKDALPDMVNDIPDEPDLSEPQRASWGEGFPYITTTPLDAGGLPPEGQDFNGIFRDLSQHIVHLNLGGLYKFSADVVAAGGYHKGAILLSNNDTALWISLRDGNIQDFNSGNPTLWARIAFSGLDAVLNGKVDKVSVVQVTGQSTSDIMSQKAVTDLFASIGISQGNDAGMIAHFARNTPPPGWLKANGSAVSRATYANLFAAIGTTFGAGDGATTFNLPDLRGEFVRSWDDGRGVDAGRNFGSAQLGQNELHTHSGVTSVSGNHTHGYTDYRTAPGGSGASTGSGFTTQALSSTTQAAGSHSHTLTIAESGGSESRPRNVALLACIKF